LHDIALTSFEMKLLTLMTKQNSQHVCCWRNKKKWFYDFKNSYFTY